MSSFIELLKAEANNAKVLTENGATAYATSGSALVDINFAVSELRSATLKRISKMYAKAYFENPELALKWLFFARDIRGGMGERRLFRACYAWLAKHNAEVAKQLIPLVMEYGRADDLVDVAANVKQLWNSAVDYIAKILTSDIKNAAAGKPITLLAKWLPSCNTSSYETRCRARKLANSLGMSISTYRRTLAKLRKRLDVVEVKLSAGEWGKVSYEHVPSKANLKYKNAFMKHDEARRTEYLSKLEKGKAKINSSASFPCDIVNSYYSSFGRIGPLDQTLESMWKSLPDYMSQDDGNTIVVADSSGSMTAKIGSSSVTALAVANSLAIYFAERMSESPYKNKFITFSCSPQLVDMSGCSSLHDKLALADAMAEISNTDIERTMQLILDTAVKNHVEQKDIPNVLIVSDMNFDCGTVRHDSKTLMEQIESQFNAYGYKMPRITYWNVCGGIGRTAPVPVQKSESGVALVSGFSPAIASMVYSSKLDPYEVLVEKLSTPRYDLAAMLEKLSK